MKIIDRLKQRCQADYAASSYPKKKKFAMNSLYVDPEGEVHALPSLSLVDGIISLDNTCKLDYDLRAFDYDFLEATDGLIAFYDKHPSYRRYIPKLELLQRDFVEILSALSANQRFEDAVFGLVSDGADANATAVQLVPKSQAFAAPFRARKKANCFTLKKKPRDETCSLAIHLRRLVEAHGSLQNYLQKLPNFFSVKNCQSKLQKMLVTEMKTNSQISLLEGVGFAKSYICKQLDQLRQQQNSLASFTEISAEDICIALNWDPGMLLKSALNDEGYALTLGEIINCVWASLKIQISANDPMIDCLSTHLSERDELVAQQYGQNDSRQNIFSITLQFFMAVANVYCREQGLSDSDFGEVLESLSTLRRFLHAVKDALKNAKPLQEVCLQVISGDYLAFGLSEPLSAVHQQGILELFKLSAGVLTNFSNMRRYDEFVFLLRKPGIFTLYRSRICVSLQTVKAALSLGSQRYRFDNWYINSSESSTLPAIDEAFGYSWKKSRAGLCFSAIIYFLAVLSDDTDEIDAEFIQLMLEKIRVADMTADVPRLADDKINALLEGLSNYILDAANVLMARDVLSIQTLLSWFDSYTSGRFDMQIQTLRRVLAERPGLLVEYPQVLQGDVEEDEEPAPWPNFYVESKRLHNYVSLLQDPLTQQALSDLLGLRNRNRNHWQMLSRLDAEQVQRMVGRMVNRDAELPSWYTPFITSLRNIMQQTIFRLRAALYFVSFVGTMCGGVKAPFFALLSIGGYFISDSGLLNAWRNVKFVHECISHSWYHSYVCLFNQQVPALRARLFGEPLLVPEAVVRTEDFDNR